MNEDNNVIAEISNEDLGVEEIYPSSVMGTYKNKTFQAFLIDSEEALLVMMPDKIVHLDVSNLEEGISVTAKAGLAKKKYQRTHHCYVNEDSRTVYIS